MTDWIKVCGDIKPLELDLTSSSTTVYERRNAVLVEKEMDGQTYIEWEYEERTFTMQEYASMLSKQNSDALDEYGAQVLYTALMTDTLIEEG